MRAENTPSHTAARCFPFAAKITHSSGNRKQRGCFPVIYSVFRRTDSVIAASRPRSSEKATACHDTRGDKRYKDAAHQTAGNSNRRKGRRASPKPELSVIRRAPRTLAERSIPIFQSHGKQKENKKKTNDMFIPPGLRDALTITKKENDTMERSVSKNDGDCE